MQELQVVSRLLAAMAESGDADDFCDLLANSVLAEFEVVATCVAVLESDGRITMVGSWGYPLVRRAPDDRPSLWHPMAITDTIRSGEVLAFDTWADYLARYPHLELRAGPGESFVCIPLSNGNHRTGGLGLTFNKPLADCGLSSELWPILAAAANVLIAKAWPRSIFGKLSDATSPVVDASQQERAHDALTSRELQVLRLLADGLTTNQIASRLHLSDSTIKQTRMSLNRKLGVRSRVELEFAARSLGLLPDASAAP